MVFSLFGSGKLTAKVKELGIPSRNFSIKSSLDFVGILPTMQMHNLYKEIKSNKYDIIQTFGLRADTVGRIIAKLSRIPVIISSIRSPDPWRKPWHTALDRLTAPLVTLYISNSDAGKESRIKREKFPPEKIKVIHNAIELNHIKLSESEKNDLKNQIGIFPKDSPIVLTIANLRNMKGHKDIVDSIIKIKEELPDIKFIFVGRDDSNGDILQYAQDRDVDKYILFEGYQEDVSKYYNIADMFLLPSYWEGCPASILEAMSYGLPVIATDVGGIPEVIKNHETGLLINSGHPNEISDAIIKLKNDEHLKNTIIKNQENELEKRFNIEIMVKEISETYISLYNSRIKKGDKQ